MAARTSAPPRKTAAAAKRRLRAFADPVRAGFVAGYFKTGKGEYGEGDRFIGVTMPQIRRVAREFRGLPVPEAVALLASPVHEDRMLGVIVLSDLYARGDDALRAAVYAAYLANTARINNWDLVDVSAPGVVGRHLGTRSRAPLRRLARSTSLWERRIAVLGAMWFLRSGETAPTFELAERLLGDPHDLMHKAIGWSLREAAKRDGVAARVFLDRHAPRMPRTMLRYAIERFPAAERARYMAIPSVVARRPRHRGA